jgi:hypothetical protein
VVIGVDDKLGLQSILANGPSITGSSKTRPFAGSTDKGIQIGSTRAAIESAYGKDYIVGGISVVNHPEIHEIQLIYRRLGLFAIIDSASEHCVGLWLVPPNNMKSSINP